MRCGRRSGTAPTRFRITSLNRHSGGAPAGGGTFRGNSGRGHSHEFFRTLMSRKRWLRLLGVTQGPCQHPAGVLAHALVMICIAEMKRELPRFLPIQR